VNEKASNEPNDFDLNTNVTSELRLGIGSDSFRAKPFSQGRSGRESCESHPGALTVQRLVVAWGFV
jgi:hypothetical protein